MKKQTYWIDLFTAQPGKRNELNLILLLPREGLIENANFTFYIPTGENKRSFLMTIKSLSL